MFFLCPINVSYIFFLLASKNRRLEYCAYVTVSFLTRFKYDARNLFTMITITCNLLCKKGTTFIYEESLLLKYYRPLSFRMSPAELNFIQAEKSFYELHKGIYVRSYEKANESSNEINWLKKISLEIVYTLGISHFASFYNTILGFLSLEKKDVLSSPFCHYYPYYYYLLVIEKNLYTLFHPCRIPTATHKRKIWRICVCLSRCFFEEYYFGKCLMSHWDNTNYMDEKASISTRTS